jgi:hypothetical protein
LTGPYREGDHGALDHVGALEPLTTALAADGYELVVTVTGPGAARLVVAAGEDACAECLVPQQLFVDIARRRLEEALGGTWAVEVVYP